jgi:hypothetical protein
VQLLVRPDGPGNRDDPGRPVGDAKIAEQMANLGLQRFNHGRDANACSVEGKSLEVAGRGADHLGIIGRRGRFSGWGTKREKMGIKG